MNVESTLKINRTELQILFYFSKSKCPFNNYNSYEHMIKGKFPAYIFPLIGSLSAMFTIILIYYIAVDMGHEQPLPNTYISNTAKHYPQFIFFRMATISGAVLLILSYMVNYLWLKSIQIETGYKVNKFVPEIPAVMGIVAILSLFVSTATIDTGKMDGKLHGHCAGVFFVLSIANSLYNTVIVLATYYATKSYGKIYKYSVFVKLCISVLIIYQIALSIKDGSGFFDKNGSDLSHILEYTFTFSLLGYMLTMAYDFKDFTLGYTLAQ